MKLFVTIYLLGACLNLAMANGTKIESNSHYDKVESHEEVTTPKFTTLVKKTMDLLAPIQELNEISISKENKSLSLTK